MTRRSLKEILENMAMLTNPGEYGLGFQPESHSADDKKAWVIMNDLVEEAQRIVNPVEPAPAPAPAPPIYKEAYAVIIDAHRLTRDEHDSLQEYIEHFITTTNAFTPFEAYFDLAYSDTIIPHNDEDVE